MTHSLRPLWREWRLFILGWAMREIDPLHPDVPGIVLEMNHWRQAMSEAELNAAYAEGRADEREEWTALLEAAKCAEGVLFLLSKELEAMGNKAPNVRQMLSNAIARIESEAAEAYALRRDERQMQAQFP